MKYSVYTLTFANGVTYVGSSRDLKRRFENHLNRFRGNKHIANLQTLYDEHGAPAMQEVANAFSLGQLHELEQKIILQTEGCVNCATPEPHQPSFGDTYGPYQSKAEAARALGCSYKTIKRKSATLSYNEFVNWLDSHKAWVPQHLCPPDPRNNNALIFHNGWYRRHDVAVVPLVTAARRRESGWSDWDSLVTPMGSPNPARVQRVSVSAVCRKYGVDPNVYFQRRHKGWSLLEAMGLKVRNEQCRKPKVQQRVISADGKTMPLNAWASKLGVHPRVIHSRLALGWSEHDAVTTPKRVQTEKADKQPRKPRELRLVTVQGFTGTINEVAKHYGVAPGLLRSRIAANWPEDALLLGKSQRARVPTGWGVKYAGGFLS